jgi:mono/diheme cytochrome c family protein
MPDLRQLRTRLVCSTVLLLAPVPLQAQEQSVQFAKDVLPIFNKHCLKCHGDESRKGDLSLQTLSGIVQGGESGEPILVAGDAHASRMLELVESGEMPPDKSQLNATEIKTLADWINTAAQRELLTVENPLSPELLLARKVHFLLEIRCQPCHGRTKQEGELDLRTMTDILKGGKSGPAIVRGDADNSLLLRRLHDDEMPPRDIRYRLSIRPVTESEQQMIGAWIDAGAADPPPLPSVIDDDGLLVSDEDRTWWAFQPPVAVDLPDVKAQSQVQTPIDAFLLRKLEEQQLTYSAAADRQTLIRRASIDLLGLTPSLQDVQTFIADDEPYAFERLVDRLLDSPRYGERWGQHWLDAAGYSDSEGSAAADQLFPLVHKYRDYVIRSLNADKPYDQFLTEQLAGDELHDYRSAERMTPELRDSLIATGFLRTCIDPTDSPELNFPYDRYQVLADTVEIVSSSLMGLTMRCARCHSHKYDPIPQRDYYRFTAIFSPAYAPHDWVKPLQRTMELAGTEDRREIAEFNASIQEQIDPINDKTSDLNNEFQQRYVREHPDTEDKAISRELLEKTYADFKQRLATLIGEKQELEAKLRKVPLVHGLTDMRPQPDPHYLLRRGEWNNRGRRVLPNAPAVVNKELEAFKITRPFPDAPTSGTRLALAKWLTQPNHPLTARVLVNRVWQQHFGRGIVSTAEDFGKTGVPPTHPELLDWLAVDFVNHGWSMKHLHRMIVNSSAWRQQSRVRDVSAAIDPENKLLWRMPLRRMDAEVVRDSMLKVSGQLNLSMHGPAVPLHTLPDGQVVGEESAEGNRRSIYLLHRRSTPITLLETFDAPRLTTNCIQRRTSNVVSQALLMLNSGFVDQQAEAVAEQIAASAHDTPDQVSAAWLHVLGREPNAAEAARAKFFLAQQTGNYVLLDGPAGAANGDSDTAPGLTGSSFAERNGPLVDLCLVLLNSAEFLYVD